MVHPHFISSVLYEPWAISEESVIGLSHVISNIFNPNIAFEPGTPTLPSLRAVALPSAAKPGTSGLAFGMPTQKQIAVISISGPLMKNDQYCGPAGMKTIGQWIQEADSDPATNGILLVIDSPGGTVAGTQELGTIIKGTKKPIVAFIEDQACSAAYWLASCAREIIANNTTAQVGSIGVLLSFMDVQPALEKEGVKFHTITAPQSTEKTSMFDKIRKGEYNEYKNTVLKPLAAKFIETVKGNRPAITDELLTGAVVFANDSLNILVDSIATFDQALQRVAILSEENSPTATSNSPSITMNIPKLDRLAKAVDVDAFESADGSITLTAEQAVAAETALEAAETAQASLQSQLDAAAPHAARITELEAQLQTANARITELSQEAGAISATVITETDSQALNAETESFHTRLVDLIQLKNK